MLLFVADVAATLRPFFLAATLQPMPVKAVAAWRIFFGEGAENRCSSPPFSLGGGKGGFLTQGGVNEASEEAMC